MNFFKLTLFLAKSAKFKNKSGELMALYGNNPPKKTCLLTIKAKLFNLRVTANCMSLQIMERNCILSEKRKK